MTSAVATLTSVSGTIQKPIRQSASEVSKKTPSGFLISPTFDLLLVANLFWPLIALAVYAGSENISGSLSALQMYFLSTPHRWITLILVFGDRDRFATNPIRYGGIGLGLIALGLALVAVGTYFPEAHGPLVPLMMLDFIWNSWHFAAQHAGISRIYGRMTRPEQTAKAAEFEKMALRLVVLWFFFRLGITIAGRTGFDLAEHWKTVVQWVDVLIFIPGVVLLFREFCGFTSRHIGRVVYILSVLGVYAAQLAAIRSGDGQVMAAMFVAGAMFHAGEYLAIVGWSVRRKSGGIWKFLVPRLVCSVLLFMVILGITARIIETEYAWGWALVTLLVSLLHYGYDGIIWKAKPKSAN